MFVLRRVLNDVYVNNIIIGYAYTVYFKDEHKDDFDYFLKSNRLEDKADKIFAFVVGNEDGDEYPLYNNSRYYMMTSTGSTFEKINK